MKVFNIVNSGGTPTNSTVIDITDKLTLNLSNDVYNVCYSLYDNTVTVGKSIDIDVTATQNFYILVNKEGASLNINIKVNGGDVKTILANQSLIKIANYGSWVIDQILPID